MDMLDQVIRKTKNIRFLAWLRWEEEKAQRQIPFAAISDVFSKGGLRPGIVIPLCIAAVFFADLFVHLVRHHEMFLKRYGRRHRLTGLVFLLWLYFGFLDVAFEFLPFGYGLFGYDLVLGLMGTTLTLTAAYDFKSAHEMVRNRASGPLDEDATVTFDEMLEHAFYQGLNLVQILYLHSVGLLESMWLRAILCVLATLPWTGRRLFPVNSFSKNYTGPYANPWTLVSILYRVKKYQYILYKHALLHGLNVSVAISGPKITQRSYFRLYWVSLYASYTFEFFLQSLVKKGYMQQRRALRLNRMLMLISTVAAVQVLAAEVDLWYAAISLVLNFIHRHHDFMNTIFVLAFALGQNYDLPK